jgi:hypothetical protein
MRTSSKTGTKKPKPTETKNTEGQTRKKTNFSRGNEKQPNLARPREGCILLDVIERQNQRETTNNSSVFFIDDVYVYIQWEGMQSKRHNC